MGFEDVGDFQSCGAVTREGNMLDERRGFRITSDVIRNPRVLPSVPLPHRSRMRLVAGLDQSFVGEENRRSSAGTLRVSP